MENTDIMSLYPKKLVEMCGNNPTGNRLIWACMRYIKNRKALEGNNLTLEYVAKTNKLVYNAILRTSGYVYGILAPTEEQIKAARYNPLKMLIMWRLDNIWKSKRYKDYKVNKYYEKEKNYL